MLQRSDNKFVRLLAALVMAAVVTGGLLYGMNKVAITLRMRDPTRYFRISDVIVPKPSGPAKRPAEAQMQPARQPLQYGTPKKSTLPVDQPPLVVPKPAPAGPDVTPAIPLAHADQDASPKH